jgi:hypothetical protein
MRIIIRLLVGIPLSIIITLFFGVVILGLMVIEYAWHNGDYYATKECFNDSKQIILNLLKGGIDR